MKGALAAMLDPTLLLRRAGVVPDAWQERVLRSRARSLLLCCSRQAGKSTVTAALALHAALRDRPALGPDRREQRVPVRILGGAHVEGEVDPARDDVDGARLRHG